MRDFIASVYQKSVFFIIIIFVKIFFGFEVRGAENLKGLNNKGVIFAGNHFCFFDGIFSGIAIGVAQGKNNIDFTPVKYLVYEDFFNFFRFFGKFKFPFSIIIACWLRISACIPVRARKKNEYKSILLKQVLGKVIEAINNKDSIFIFPEGRISKDGKIQQGKRGIVCLHKKTGAPIVPTGIKGTYKMFSWKNLKKPRAERKIVVTFGSPIINLSDLEKSKMELGVERIMKKIEELI